MRTYNWFTEDEYEKRRLRTVIPDEVTQRIKERNTTIGRVMTVVLPLAALCLWMTAGCAHLETAAKSASELGFHVSADVDKDGVAGEVGLGVVEVGVSVALPWAEDE